MRILHVVSRSQRRGAELVALDLARGLDARGHANRVVALAQGFDGSEQPGLPALVRSPRSEPVTLLGGARALRHELRRAPVDVVLAHGGRAVEAAAFVRGRRGPRLVWQRVLGFPPSIWRAPRRQWWQIVVRRVDAAVTLTDELAQELRRLGYRGPATTIPNFRDPQRFMTVDRVRDAADLRKTLRLDAGTQVIAWVGHIIAQKRPDRALDVLAEVHRREVPAHLAVAGDGPLRTDLVHRARARQLDAYVHLLGEREDVEHLYGGADVFLLTSDAEGIPGVLVEALMTGCPTVAPAVGAVGEVVRDGETGFLVRGGGAEGLAGRVAEVLGDPDLARRMTARSQQLAPEFSTGRAVARYCELLEEVTPR